MSLPRVHENKGMSRAPSGMSPEAAFDATASAIIAETHDKYVQDPARKFETQVKKAAEKAQNKFASKPRKCYKTTAYFMELMGARPTANPMTSSRGMPVSHLRKLIEIGKLKPGMQVYLSRKPGTDPQSLHLWNKPHWAIYVGRDAKGFPRLMDQYRNNWSLTDFESEYGATRKIDTLFDPLRAKRPHLPGDTQTI